MGTGFVAPAAEPVPSPTRLLPVTTHTIGVPQSLSYPSKLPPGRRAGQASHPVASSTTRILFLTADTPLARRLRYVLQTESGICTRIDVCTHPLCLVEHYVSVHSNLIVLDWQACGPPALNLIRTLRAIHPGCTVILLLPASLVELCTEAVQLGNVLYLFTPTGVREIARLVSQLLPQRIAKAA